MIDAEIGIESVGDEIAVDIVGGRRNDGIEAIDDAVAVDVCVAGEIDADRDLAFIGPDQGLNVFPCARVDDGGSVVGVTSTPFE